MMDMLNYLCALYDELQTSSSDPNTLFEIKRKKIKEKGYQTFLIWCFNIFLKLEILCRQRLTHKHLKVLLEKTMFTVVNEENSQLS